MGHGLSSQQTKILLLAHAAHKRCRDLATIDRPDLSYAEALWAEHGWRIDAANPYNVLEYQWYEPKFDRAAVGDGPYNSATAAMLRSCVRLEKRGYVERHYRAGERQAHGITLTDCGVEAAKGWIDAHRPGSDGGLFTAMHEAGHAVLGLAMREPCIMIVRGEALTNKAGIFGTCSTQGIRVEKSSDIFRMLVGMWGGIVVDARLRSGPMRTVLTFGGYGDHADIQRLVQSVFGTSKKSQREYLISAAHKTAKRLAAKHWKAISDVADALESYRALPGAEVFRIAKKADASLFWDADVEDFDLRILKMMTEASRK